MRAKEFVIETRKGLSSKLPTLQKRNYSSWLQSKLKGKLGEKKDSIDTQEIEEEVVKFVAWAGNILNLNTLPELHLSTDTDKAQSNPSTGQYTPSNGKIWVYIKNRNLIDILRTVFHELVHYRQNEIGMIKPNSSYPGSPIEAMADMLAGKYIKIYSKDNPHVYQ